MATVNTDNYLITGVDLYFEASIAHASLLDTSGTTMVGSSFRTTARNLGNITTLDISPTVSYVEHFISVNGKRKKDKIAANEESVTIPFTFDEINENNMKRFFLASSLGNNKLALMQKPLIEGSVSLKITTDVGNDMVLSIPKAIIRPDGNLSFGDGTSWTTAPMSLEILYYDSWASKPFGVLDMNP